MRAASWLLLAGLWLHFASTLPATTRVQLADFAGYYGAGAVVLSGDTHELYDSERKWFTNLPVVSVLFAPLAALDYRVAWHLFWWLQVLSFAASFGLLLWGIARDFGPLTPPRAALAAAVFLCFAPVLRRCLQLGQTTPMMLLAMVGCWLLLRRARPGAAGLVLGGVCLIKIPPLAWLAVFAARRRLRVAGLALAVVAAGVAASWLLFGGELLGQYADRILVGNAGRSHGAFNNRSLDGAFTRLLSDRSLLDWDPQPRPAAVTAAVAATGLALLGLLLARGRGLLWPATPPRDDDPRHGSLELELAVGAALMVLGFPVVWVHYYLFLALPAVLLPFWWRARGLRLSWPVLALLLAGLWLASGSDVPGNVEVAERRLEPGFRALQSLQPLGAVLLVLGLSDPLAQLARRARADAAQGA